MVLLQPVQATIPRRRSVRARVGVLEDVLGSTGDGRASFLTARGGGALRRRGGGALFRRRRRRPHATQARLCRNRQQADFRKSLALDLYWSGLVYGFYAYRWSVFA